MDEREHATKQNVAKKVNLIWSGLFEGGSAWGVGGEGGGGGECPRLIPLELLMIMK